MTRRRRLVIAVPALVLIGVPMLWAVAVAQVQSTFIATVATLGYLVQGNVSVIDPGRLKVALAVVLIAVGPYLAL